MRVLVAEARPGLADDIVGELVEAGHAVARCQEPDAPAFPCRGMTPGECPLDEAPVQAVVAVDDRAGRPAPPADFDGVRCAVRRNIPVVVAGPAPSPLAPWASRTSASSPATAAVLAVEGAAAAPLVRHSTAALRELRALLAMRGCANDAATASVTQVDGGLKVALSPGVKVDDKRLLEMMSIRVLAAVRKVDPDAARISVVVAP